MSRENKRARGGGKFLDFLLSVFVTGEPPLFLLLVRRDYYSVLILPCHTFLLLLLLLHLTASLTVSIFCSPTFLRSHPFLVIDFYFSFFFSSCDFADGSPRIPAPTDRLGLRSHPAARRHWNQIRSHPNVRSYASIFFLLLSFFSLIFYLTPDPQ